MRRAVMFAMFVMLASAVVHVAYFTILLTGYRKSDLTVVYPVARGSGPLLSTLGAVLVLGEPLGWRTVAGVLAISGGVLLIAGGPRLWQGHAAPAERLRTLAGLRPSLAMLLRALGGGAEVEIIEAPAARANHKRIDSTQAVNQCGLFRVRYSKLLSLY